MRFRNELRCNIAALCGIIVIAIAAVVLGITGLITREMDYLFMSMALCIAGYLGAKRGIAHYHKMYARVEKIKSGAGDESDAEWIK